MQLHNTVLLPSVSTVDWMVSDFIGIRQGSLGRIRYILKSGLKYLPLYGFYFAQVSQKGKAHGGPFFETPV